MENLNPESLLQKAQALGDDIKGIESIDVEHAYRRMQQKIKSSRRKMIYNQCMRYAAFLTLPLLLASLTLGYLYFHKPVVDEKYAEVTAAMGSVIRYELPDHSVVWLNAGSTIIYPEEFIGRFRQIFFTGEGHFSVAKNKEKPFIIKSNESSIEVLGTQFNLKSYSNDNRIEVALLDGSVAFCYPSTTDQEMKCILSPGEQVYYNRTTHNLEKKNFILSDYSSWKDGKYYFKNETLEDIAKQLERNFDVNIIIKNDSLKQIPYHMAFVNNETLDDILSAMNLDGYLTIKRDGKIIEIY